MPSIVRVAALGLDPLRRGTGSLAVLRLAEGGRLCPVSGPVSGVSVDSNPCTLLTRHPGGQSEEGSEASSSATAEAATAAAAAATAAYSLVAERKALDNRRWRLGVRGGRGVAGARGPTPARRARRNASLAWRASSIGEDCSRASAARRPGPCRLKGSSCHQSIILCNPSNFASIPIGGRFYCPLSSFLPPLPTLHMAKSNTTVTTITPRTHAS
jgi:hypothetical protein